jgi:hypothetical protein
MIIIHTPALLAMATVTIFSKGAANLQGRGNQKIYFKLKFRPFNTIFTVLCEGFIIEEYF